MRKLYKIGQYILVCERIDAQVLVLKNESIEVKLEASQLSNGKTDTVVLDEYNLYMSIKSIIVADTADVNNWKQESG